MNNINKKMKENENELESKFDESFELDKTIEESLRKKSILSTCQILTKNSNNESISGTGFFCKFPYENKLIKVLFTSNKVLNKEIIERDKIITLKYKTDEIIELKMERRFYYSNVDLDFTCIKIFDEDKIKDYFNIYNYSTIEKSNNEEIAICQYPQGGNLEIKTGYLNKIEGEKIKYLGTTYIGSSGSPIILLKNCSVIGIHLESSSELKMNLGVFIQNIKEDINEKIRE